MSKAKNLFDEWLAVRDELRKNIIKLNVERDNDKLDYHSNQALFHLDGLEKKCREIFKHDEVRIAERNKTISYLQDRLAENSGK